MLVALCISSKAELDAPDQEHCASLGSRTRSIKGSQVVAHLLVSLLGLKLLQAPWGSLTTVVERRPLPQLTWD